MIKTKNIKVNVEDDEFLMNEIRQMIIEENPQLQRFEFTRRMLFNEVLNYVAKNKKILRRKSQYYE